MERFIPIALPIASFVTCLVVWISSYLCSRKINVPSKSPLRQVPSWLFAYGRRIIFAVAILWAYAVYYMEAQSQPVASYALSSMMRTYGLTGLLLLFAVLTPGVIISYFPRFFLNAFLIHLRRALGVSVFFFGFLHGTIGFFNNLSGNIASFTFLSSQHQLALVFSSGAFVIYSLMAITSFDTMVAKLGNKRWKMLHRFVYVAGIFTVFHAFLIGSHFINATSTIPVIANYLALTFVLLEISATFKRSVQGAGSAFWRHGFGAVLLLTVALTAFYMSYQGSTRVYDPHARHRKGYSKNYILEVKSQPQVISAGQPVDLTFTVTDKRTGRPLAKYQVLQEKLMHVVVLRKDLSYYDHIHPEYDNQGSFTVSTQFPEGGTYNLFVEYSPPDFYENLSVATLRVGDVTGEKSAALSVGSFTKEFESRYRVTLTPSDPFRVNETVDFTYTLEDATTGTPITELEPYLAAFGHMSAASEDLATYTHVHPLNVPLSPQDKGGPQVRFSTFFPKPGFYKLFTQFKHQGKIFVTDFIVEVK